MSCVRPRKNWLLDRDGHQQFSAELLVVLKLQHMLFFLSACILLVGVC